MNLILKDGAKLKANQGITAHNGNYLTIYAQSEDDNEMGCIEIPSNLGMNAGIGGIFDNFSSDKGNCGTVTFNGGRISFTQGESGSVNERKAAGIGGAYTLTRRRFLAQIRTVFSWISCRIRRASNAAAA